MSAIKLEGVINFRDFGGAAGAGGRRIKRGRLYRSGHHAAATPADLERLAALDLALIVDLRRPPERTRDPALRPAGGRAEVLEHGGPADETLVPHLSFLAEPDATPQHVRDRMIEHYQGYPFDPHYVALFRAYFARLAELDRPVLVNCHAGKDRTGLLCALTLSVLGAHRDDIYEDYLATNRHSRADARMAELARLFEANYGRSVSEAMFRSVMAAEADYLDAAFAAIEARHGPLDSYLDEALGLTPKRREAIQARLLD